MMAAFSDCSKKIEKLIPRLEAIIQTVQNEGRSLRVSKMIDDFFYRQKIEELSLLKRELLLANNQSLYRITSIIYMDAFKRWKKEVRLLNQLLLTKNTERVTIL